MSRGFERFAGKFARRLRHNSRQSGNIGKIRDNRFVHLRNWTRCAILVANQVRQVIHDLTNDIRVGLNQPGIFSGEIIHREHIGKTADELVALWNADHPGDPVS